MSNMERVFEEADRQGYELQIAHLDSQLFLIKKGADPTPVEEACMPTPGQLWHKLLTMEPDKRMEHLYRIMEELDFAHQARMRGLTERVQSVRLDETKTT